MKKIRYVLAATALPGHWMKVFAKLAADPGYTPEMPDEYLRMAREEGLPDAFR